MTKKEKEQYRLDIRAGAFSDAASTAKFYSNAGMDPVEQLYKLAKTSSQAASEYRKFWKL